MNIIQDSVLLYHAYSTVAFITPRLFFQIKSLLYSSRKPLMLCQDEDQTTGEEVLASVTAVAIFLLLIKKKNDDWMTLLHRHNDSPGLGITLAAPLAWHHPNDGMWRSNTQGMTNIETWTRQLDHLVTGLHVDNMRHEGLYIEIVHLCYANDR
ncbi:hypothetical protein ACJX0J_009575 [Zea mays]